MGSCGAGLADYANSAQIGGRIAVERSNSGCWHLNLNNRIHRPCARLWVRWRFSNGQRITQMGNSRHRHAICRFVQMYINTKHQTNICTRLSLGLADYAEPSVGAARKQETNRHGTMLILRRKSRVLQKSAQGMQKSLLLRLPADG